MKMSLMILDEISEKKKKSQISSKQKVDQHARYVEGHFINLRVVEF
jgi:hypothetical protein